MNPDQTAKVTPDHLKRLAYLYVRQSTFRQMVNNRESTCRQYDFRGRAVALGWPLDRIVTIDADLGQSGAHAAHREGFQHLVAEVSMGRAGIVLGLEVSRLARNFSDWHRLVELCAYTRTLILDEDGLYDPTRFNDRLLLGLKGTLSEAELHVLYARLRGGILNKAKRAELRLPLPAGLVYDPKGHVVLDPDQQVQETFRLFFRTFFRLGTAMATVRYFRVNKLRFPRRINGGPRHGELAWGVLGVNRAVQVLHNPRFAGAFAYGRLRSRTGPDGKVKTTAVPRDQWIALVRDAHPGYITWEQFETIERMLEQTAKAYGIGKDRRAGPPREGSALLQGRVVCGRCGARLSVRYHRRPHGLVPDYFCINRGPTATDSPCQIIPGAVVDEAIGQLILDAIQPSALQIALAVQDEIRTRLEEVEQHNQRHIERAQYEADLARRRFMKVDPDHRIVADSLEADWNEKLRAVEEARRQHEEQRARDQLVLTEEARRRITNLADEFPAVWQDPQTPIRERKRMLALLIEDVTLIKRERITAHVRFRGGATTTLDLAIALNAWQQRATRPDIVRRIDELLDEHHDNQVADILNQQGLQTGADMRFTGDAVRWVRYNHGLKSLKQRLIERGMVTGPELRKRLRVGPETILAWRRSGRLEGRTYNDNGHWIYTMPDRDTLPIQTSRNREQGKQNGQITTEAV